MASLWFKKRYVEPILSGQKTSTIRMKKPKVGVGDTVTFHVGPKPSFATVQIQSVEEVAFDDLPPARKDGLRSVYDRHGLLFDDGPATVWCIQFELVN